MFKVTKNAATRILEAAQAGEMEGLALRLAPYYKSDGRPTKAPVDLPQQCVLRWDFLAKNKGANEANPPP